MAIFRVVIKARARKQLRRCPGHIIDKLETWVDAVEQRGLEEARKIPGYHDEPLHEDRAGQRSIRLSKELPRDLRGAERGESRIRTGRGGLET